MTSESIDAATPAGILVVTFGSHVFGLAAAEGTLLWTCDAVFGEPRVEIVGNRVILSNAIQLVCLRYSDGVVLWEQRPPFSVGTMLCTDGKIFVGGSGETACYDGAGALLWHERFKGKGKGKVALAVPGKASQVDHIG